MAGQAQGNGGKAGTSNGLGGRTRIINLAKSNMTEAESIFTNRYQRNKATQE